MGDYDTYSDLELTRGQLIDMLAQSLGTEKAASEIISTARALGIEGNVIRGDQALTLLESLSKKPGMVGIVSRLAKNRIILRTT